MIERVFNPGFMLRFSRWNRKGYAIFASLGREVRIGTLAIRVCEMSARKGARKGAIAVLRVGRGLLDRSFEARAEKVERAARGVSFPARGDADGAVRVGVYTRERYGCRLTGVPFLVKS